MNHLQKYSLKLVSAKPRKARRDPLVEGLREQPKTRAGKPGRGLQQD